MRETEAGYYEYRTSDLLYSLHLPSRQWTELSPGGARPPPPSEKGVAWHHGDSFYSFSGFCWDGERLERLRSQDGGWEMERDGHTGGGWHNALVCYHTQTNSYQWPTLAGNLPSPRAGAAVCVREHEVFIFGGRCRQRRLNDLYCINLLSGTCTTVDPGTSPDMFLAPSLTEPAPRSLHSLTWDGAGRLALYGGLGQLSAPLNDCWLLELDTFLWREQDLGYDHGEVRCWHSAVLAHAELVILSGLTQEHYLTRLDLDDHCQDILRLKFGPTSLKKLSLESVIRYLTFKDESKIIEVIQCLPSILKKSVLTRTCKTYQSSETDTETDYSRSRLHSGI